VLGALGILAVTEAITCVVDAVRAVLELITHAQAPRIGRTVGVSAIRNAVAVFVEPTRADLV